MSKQNKQGARTARKCGRAHLLAVERMFRDGRILERAEAYVNDCLNGERAGERALFPNLAGFGRALGVGLGELWRMGDKYPAIYDAILAVLEDGALNTERIPGKSALLAMTYFRRRLGYETPKAEIKEREDKEVRLVFEHDIAEDGR